MKTQTKTLFLFLLSGFLSSLGLQAQTWNSSPWAGSTTAPGSGIDSYGTVISAAAFSASLTSLTGLENTTDPELLWVPAWAAFRVGSFTSAPSTSSMGQYSVAMGSATANNTYAIALGDFVDFATGPNSVALGESVAIGSYSVAMGGGSTAYGSNSTALGQSIANGSLSTSTGTATAISYGETAVGFYNTGGGVSSPSTTTWVPTDPLFEIGNGGYQIIPGLPDFIGNTTVGTSDAFIVLKNGNTWAQGTLSSHGEMRCPQAGDLSMGSFTSGTAP